MIRIIGANISNITDLEYRLLYEMASAERKMKADHYYRREDAIRCVTADALLRYVLGTDAYTIGKSACGKPFVRGRESFHYNLSHAGNWVVLAFGSSAVGVDVEETRSDLNIGAIARRFFSAEEQQYIWEEPEKSNRRFFEVWVGKESYIKYLGTGLNSNMAAFSIFCPELDVRLHQRMLDDRHILSLCTLCCDYSFEVLDVKQLLQGVRQ